MHHQEKSEFIKKEIEAIYEEFDILLDRLNLLKPFLKELVVVSNDYETSKELTKSEQIDK